MLAKDKLSTIEVLVSKAIIDSYISHDEFVSMNDVLKEYDDMKKTIKNTNTFNSVNKYDWYSKTNINTKKGFTDTNYEKSRESLGYIENN